MNGGSSHFTAADLAEIAAFTARQFGLGFPGERLPDLARGVARAAADLGYRSPGDLLRDLREAQPKPPTLDTLVAHLTVGETYFFREPACFEALRERVLPNLIQSRRAASQRRLRIWSAGCCTGEEPYSIAMLLDSLIPDLAEWEIEIIGTDINRRFLHVAERGIYHDWSFRNVPDGIRERYFRRQPDGRYEMQERVRGLVSFAHLNLARDEYPSPSFDLIFCRNVLMYLDPTVARGAVRRLDGALAPDGWLAVSATELMLDLFRTLAQTPTAGAIFFKKARAAPPPPAIADQQPPIRVAPPRADVPSGPPAARSERSPTPAALARRQADAGKLSEALEWADRALAQDRLDPADHYLRANILLALGERAPAAAALDRAIFLDPDFALAHFTLGLMARLDGKTRRAQRYLANALSIVARMEPHRPLADSDGMTAGRLAEVIQSISGRMNSQSAAKPRSAPADDREHV